MTYTQLTAEMRAILAYMDANIEKVEEISEHLQERIYQMLVREITLFDTVEGYLTPSRDFKARILDIENKIYKILGQKNYTETVQYFVDTFQTIEQRNVKLHKSFNDIEVGITQVRPTTALLYEQAYDGLTSGLATAYVQPAKYLLMSQVTGGASINDALKQLEMWNDDKMVTGKFTQDGKPAPNLKRYATQLARDSAFAVNRNVNNIVKDKYDLTAIAYVGGVRRDSRPICEYLVSLKRPILLTEVDALFAGNVPPEAMKFAEEKTKKGFLQGTIPGTNGDNFTQRCGGYNCLHQAMPVRAR